jgi:hypothetical protein
VTFSPRTLESKSAPMDVRVVNLRSQMWGSAERSHSIWTLIFMAANIFPYFLSF